MKKIFIFAALMLGLASCQNDNNIFGVNVNTNEEAVEFTITATAPEVVETRADYETDSGKGGLKNVPLGGNKKLRYILEIYDRDNVRSEYIHYYYTTARQAVFTPRLVPNRKYTFVIWADIVETTLDGASTVKADDVHYNTGDLTNVTLKGDWNPMDETRDAFTGFEVVESLTTADADIDIELTRPFAKIRVITTDVKEVADLHITPTHAKVEYSTKHRASFNAKSGEYGAATETKAHGIFPIKTYTDNTNQQKVVFTDYFFAPETDTEKVNFTIYVYQAGVDDAANLINQHTFNTNIPVKRNVLTTIIGNMLTIKDSFEIRGIVTDEDFADERVFGLDGAEIL